MASRSSALVVAGVIGTGLFAFAFVAAPSSCAWGLEAYVDLGAACLVALFATPFALRAGASFGSRTGMALALVAAGCAVWLAGLFAANVRIICRLF
jgi:hypothetical protein